MGKKHLQNQMFIEMKSIEKNQLLS